MVRNPWCFWAAPWRRRSRGSVRGAEATAVWLGWFAGERRASAHSIEAYGRDVAQFLAFLTQHLGAEPDLAALGALRPADLRAFLSARAMEGDVGATRARKLAAIRSFLRYLQRHQGMAPVALAGLRAPRAKPPLPRAAYRGLVRRSRT